uniref:Ig-like domain-containing protein n=1 Tax=Callorhinchus milii TaxID=7868 RepID=A0A4W3H5U4_CALMI
LLWELLPQVFAGDASVKVTQYPTATTALRGENVKFTCRVVNAQQSSDITVFWWKRGESQYLNTKPDNRKIFNSQTFQVLNVTFHDSGVYLCAVIQLGKAVGNGTGSRLTVHGNIAVWLSVQYHLKVFKYHCTFGDV